MPAAEPRFNVGSNDYQQATLPTGDRSIR